MDEIVLTGQARIEVQARRSIPSNGVAVQPSGFPDSWGESFGSSSCKCSIVRRVRELGGLSGLGGRRHKRPLFSRKGSTRGIRAG